MFQRGCIFGALTVCCVWGWAVCAQLRVLEDAKAQLQKRNEALDAALEESVLGARDEVGEEGWRGIGEGRRRTVEAWGQRMRWGIVGRQEARRMGGGKTDEEWGRRAGGVRSADKRAH